ncbi:hypothetical protein C8J57DRAFT_1249751 [Mycena rebaudengoi]|nr:hypothetical protein C8J57DRAFT_1249751 [Mycena rebaudengoi]
MRAGGGRRRRRENEVVAVGQKVTCRAAAFLLSPEQWHKEEERGKRKGLRAGGWTVGKLSRCRVRAVVSRISPITLWGKEWRDGRRINVPGGAPETSRHLLHRLAGERTLPGGVGNPTVMTVRNKGPGRMNIHGQKIEISDS